MRGFGGHGSSVSCGRAPGRVSGAGAFCVVTRSIRPFAANALVERLSVDVDAAAVAHDSEPPTVDAAADCLRRRAALVGGLLDGKPARDGRLGRGGGPAAASSSRSASRIAPARFGPTSASRRAAAVTRRPSRSVEPSTPSPTRERRPANPGRALLHQRRRWDAPNRGQPGARPRPTLGVGTRGRGSGIELTRDEVGDELGDELKPCVDAGLGGVEMSVGTSSGRAVFVGTSSGRAVFVGTSSGRALSRPSSLSSMSSASR